MFRRVHRELNIVGDLITNVPMTETHTLGISVRSLHLVLLLTPLLVKDMASPLDI